MDVSWLTFGAGSCDAPASAADSWEAIRRRLPAGEPPEAILVFLGDTAVPVGLWSAPLPLVALIPDRPTHWHRDRHLLARCDLVVCAAGVAEQLRRLGVERLHVPGRWHDMPPKDGPDADAAPCDLDLLFLGDLHPGRQRLRLPWLGRLVQLGSRWRVRILSPGHSPEEAMLRRARLLFQHSGDAADRRRLEQAAALGVVPLLPADDAAVGPCWRHGHNCLRYTAADLESLATDLLADEPRRQRMARAAQDTVSAADRLGFWPELLAILARDRATLAERAARRAAWEPHEQVLARLRQAIAGGGEADATLRADLQAVLPADDAALPRALGLLAAAAGEATGAAKHFQALLQVRPGHVLAGLYRAEALARADRGREAVEQARTALALLEGSQDPDPAALDWPPYPPGRDVFGEEWERAAWDHAGDPTGERRAKLRLLRWRLHGLLARQTGELAHRYEAALARPDLPATRAALGATLAGANRPAEAAHHLRQAVAGNPFDATAARLLHEALGQIGQSAEQQRLRQQRRLLQQAAPEAVAAEPWFTPPVRPLTGPRARVSLCMIVKDEEANLPHCLESFADLVDEVVIVDTGSSDGTREIARRYGARVYDFAWHDSFAAARNESMRHASGDWVFWPDADDRMDEGNRRKLRALFAGLGGELAAYLLRQYSPPDAAGGPALVTDQARLFRNDPRLRFEFRVHEQILPAVLRLGGVARPTDIVFQHTGYQDPALRRRKLERNGRLLLLDLAERPDDPLTLFNLGALQLDLGRDAEAVNWLRRSLERSPLGYMLLGRTHGLLAGALRRLGRFEEALSVCRRGLGLCSEDGGLLFEQAQLLGGAGELAGAESCLRRLLSSGAPASAPACGDLGLYGYKGRHWLAELCRRQGRVVEAEGEWRQAVGERPDFAPGWLSLTELWLTQGRVAEAETEVARLELKPETRAAAAAVRARLHLARREVAAARRVLEESAAAMPQALWPRLLLGQVLAGEGGDAAAAVRVLREALVLDPHQEEARRLLARLEYRPAVESPPDQGGG